MPTLLSCTVNCSVLAKLTSNFIQILMNVLLETMTVMMRLIHALTWWEVSVALVMKDMKNHFLKRGLVLVWVLF